MPEEKPEPKPENVDPLAHLRLEFDKVVEEVACPTCDNLKGTIEKKALDSLKQAKDLTEAETIFNLARFRTDLLGLLEDHCKAIPEDRKKIEEILGVKKEEKPKEKLIKPEEEIKSSE